MTDASPLHQREIKVTTVDTVTPQGKRQTWSNVSEIHDQTAEGEANAIAERVFGRLSSSVDALR